MMILTSHIHHMHHLDDINTIQTIDKSNMHKSIKDLPLQLTQAWEEAIQISIPEPYKQAHSIIISGMGGSALGPHAVVSLYGSHILKPVEIIHGYHLPGYADEHTLAIISSNSGNTEETLSTLAEAQMRHCMIIIITTGGKLKEIAEQYHYPAYIFDQKYNQTGQPRMSTGYMFMSILAFFSNLGLIRTSQQEITDAIAAMGEHNGIEIPFDQNQAKQLAQELYTALPLLIGSEFLSGTVHTIANQINENAKKMSAFFLLPELNHHLLEGLGFEQDHTIQFVIFDSELYSKRIKQRIELTKTIIEKNNFTVHIIPVNGNTPLIQSFNLLQFGSYLSFYLSILSNNDPSPIPWVNFLKKELEALPME